MRAWSKISMRTAPCSARATPRPTTPTQPASKPAPPVATDTSLIGWGVLLTLLVVLALLVVTVSEKFSKKVPDPAAESPLRKEIDDGIIRSMIVSGINPHTVIREEVHERIRLHVRAYRIAGILATRLKEEDPTGPTGERLRKSLNEGVPAGAFRFQEALASYIESVVVVEGFEEKLLRMVINGDNNDAIDKAFLEQLKSTLKEPELKRVVVATTMALTPHEDTNLAVPVAVPGMPAPKALSEDELKKKREEARKSNLQAQPLITRTVDQINLVRLLTAPSEADFTTNTVDKPAVVEAGVLPGQPYKGLAAAIKARLAAKQ